MWNIYHVIYEKTIHKNAEVLKNDKEMTCVILLTSDLMLKKNFFTELEDAVETWEAIIAPFVSMSIK